MADQETSLEGIGRPKVADGPWEGLTPRQRKAHAEKELRDLEGKPTEAQIREAERLALLEEIKERPSRRKPPPSWRLRSLSSSRVPPSMPLIG